MGEAGGMGSNPRISFSAGRCSLPKQGTTKPRIAFRDSLEVFWARMDVAGPGEGDPAWNQMRFNVHSHRKLQSGIPCDIPSDVSL